MQTASADRALRALRAGLIAVLGVAIPTAAEAAGGMPIRVHVVIEPTMETSQSFGVLGTAWDLATRAEIEKSVAEKFSVHLQGRFPHWDFASAPEKAYATLRLRAIEFPGQPNKIELQLQRYPGGGKPQPQDVTELWRVDWLQPGDVQARRVPKRATAPDVIFAALLKIDAKPEEQLIRDWLTRVPLAKGGKWIDPVPANVRELRLAVALPGQRFDPLRVSILTVSGKPTSGAAEPEVELRMKGIDVRRDLQLPSGESIAALVVCPDGAEWDARSVQGARSLEIGWIFLHEFKEPVNEGFADPLRQPVPQ